MCITKQQTPVQPINRLCSIQTGPDPERDCMLIETLLMKLALAGEVLGSMSTYIDKVAEFDGDSGDHIPPDQWAIVGAIQNITEVSHAIKCACWGHETAHLHCNDLAVETKERLSAGVQKEEVTKHA